MKIKYYAIFAIKAVKDQQLKKNFGYVVLAIKKSAYYVKVLMIKTIY